MKDKIEEYLQSDNKEMIYLGIAMIGDSILLKDRLNIVKKNLKPQFGIDVVNDKIIIMTRYFNPDSKLFVKDPTKLLKLVPCSK